MTPSLTPHSLSEVPTDWLEAFTVLVTEDRGSGDAAFVNDIAAIYRMRAIEEREGRQFTANPGEALAELARRRDLDGSKRRAARIAALTAEHARAEARIADYRGGAVRPLLRRLDAIEAELAALAVASPAG